MSFWMKVGVSINDLTCFRQSCDQNNVSYELNEDENFKWNGYQVHAFLQDREGGGRAFLIKDGGSFRVALDSDARYSSLTKRLGKNGGKLTRDYAVEATKKLMKKSGGMVDLCQEQPDGSVLLRVSSM